MTARRDGWLGPIGGPIAPWMAAAYLAPSTEEAYVDQFVVEIGVNLSPALVDPDPVADPTGGGAMPAGIDPALGASLCGDKVPLAWWEITKPDGTALRYAKVAINTGAPKQPRLEVAGTITRALSNALREARGTTVSPIFFDPARSLRTLEATDSLVGCRAAAYLSSQENLAAGLTPKRVFDGIVTDTEPLADRRFGLEVSDYLGYLLDEFAKRTFPQRVFTLADFPNMGKPNEQSDDPGNPPMLGTPVPIGYGLLSDEQSATPEGVTPGIFTGRRNVGGFNWDEYVFFGHASAGLQSLFIPYGPVLEGQSYPSRVRITKDSGYVDFMMPGDAMWTAHGLGSTPYRDFNGNRYFVVYGRGPISDYCRLGQVPLLANLGGIEDVGDGSGLLIDSLYRQIVHLLVNWIAQDYRSGAWLGIPSVGAGADLYSRINTASFEACRTLSETMVAGGIKGAFLLGANGTPWHLDEILQTAASNGAFEYGENKDGQVIASMATATATVVRTIVDVDKVIARTYRAKRRRDLVRNVVKYRYARRYAPPLAGPTPAEGNLLPVSNTEVLTDWIGTPEPLVDAASRTKYGDREEDLPLEFIRDAAVAAAVANRALMPTPPMYAEFREGPCGTDTDLGQVDRLQHADALTADARTLRCEAHTLDLDDGDDREFTVLRDNREL